MWYSAGQTQRHTLHTYVRLHVSPSADTYACTCFYKRACVQCWAEERVRGKGGREACTPTYIPLRTDILYTRTLRTDIVYTIPYTYLRAYIGAYARTNVRAYMQTYIHTHVIQTHTHCVRA